MECTWHAMNEHWQLFANRQRTKLTAPFSERLNALREEVAVFFVGVR